MGYEYAPLDRMLNRYDPKTLAEGWNTMPDGERVYFIANPAVRDFGRMRAVCSCSVIPQSGHNAIK